MTKEPRDFLKIKKDVENLPADQREACFELADHLRRVVACAGGKVGAMALALVAAENKERQ